MGQARAGEGAPQPIWPGRIGAKRIILINGTELARLMVQYGVGVRTRETYQLPRIDEDYFEAGLV